MNDVALAEYKIAESKYPKNPEPIYSMGLLYLDLNQLVKAKDCTQHAHTLSSPPDGLSRKIQRREQNAYEAGGANAQPQ